MKKDYGGVIWTNHALSRLQERGVKQGDAWAVWKRPNKSRYAASRGGWVYERSLGNQKVEVVAKKNEKGQWVILSVWSKTRNLFKKQNKKSFLDIIFGLLKLR